MGDLYLFTPLSLGTSDLKTGSRKRTPTNQRGEDPNTSLCFCNSFLHDVILPSDLKYEGSYKLNFFKMTILNRDVTATTSQYLPRSLSFSVCRGRRDHVTTVPGKSLFLTDVRTPDLYGPHLKRLSSLSHSSFLLHDERMGIDNQPKVPVHQLPNKTILTVSVLSFL